MAALFEDLRALIGTDENGSAFKQFGSQLQKPPHKLMGHHVESGVFLVPEKELAIFSYLVNGTWILKSAVVQLPLMNNAEIELPFEIVVGDNWSAIRQKVHGVLEKSEEVTRMIGDEQRECVQHTYKLGSNQFVLGLDLETGKVVFWIVCEKD